MIDNSEIIIALLKLRMSGTNGWYSGRCVFCGKDAHMGLNIVDGGFNCFAGGCGKTGSIYDLLKHINRLDLWSGKPTIDKGRILSKSITPDKIINTDVSTDTVRLPLGFTRTYSNGYLNDRGFVKEHYDSYTIGTSILHPKYCEGYVIFLIIEDGKCVGHVGRSIRNKEDIDRYNASAKLEGRKEILRWINTGSIKFERLLFGIDEIVPGVTDTIILVEGITSKAGLDKKMNLFKSQDTKCLATFGKKISMIQVTKLLNRGIKRILLGFDPDATTATKRYATMLNTYFDVLIADNCYESDDFGDMSIDKVMLLIENPISVLEFYHKSIKH